MSNPTPTMSITLAAKDMAQSLAEKEYWASKSTSPYASTEEKQDIAVATVNGGETTTTYTCTAKTHITVEGNLLDVEGLLDTDGVLYLHDGTNGTVTGGTKSWGLKTLADAKESGIDVTSTFTLTGAEGTKTGNIQASFKLVNTTEKQNDLAGKSITIKISNTEFNCDVTSDK